MRRGRHAQAAKANASPELLSPVRAYYTESNPTRPIRPSPLTASTIEGLPLELIDRLRSFPLFANAPDTFLTAIGKSLRPQLHQPHDPILIEGEDARSLYWLVRGSVRVTSRDGESTYAELKPGAFFGEIGILMDIPRTASISASARSLVVRLNKEDLQKELPKYPQVEQAIREEAVERLAILEQKKKQGSHSITSGSSLRKRSRDYMSGDVIMGDAHDIAEDEYLAAKKRKSPSPSIAEAAASSAFGKSSMPIRQILQSFPLFSNLPSDILHFLGVNAQPCTFPPFFDIIQQGTNGREVYFIVQGEVEVITDTHGPDSVMGGVEPSDSSHPVQRVRARFRQGQFFGEVASLLLAPMRTATVRSIDKVECLRITGEILDELLQKASPHVREQMEVEAKKRLDGAVTPLDGPTEPFFSMPFKDGNQRRITPTVTFSEVGFEPPAALPEPSLPVQEPLDPDPFFGTELDVPRMKSRRSSLAPPLPDQESLAPQEYEPVKPSPLGLGAISTSPRKMRSAHTSTPSSPTLSPLQPSTRISPFPSKAGKGILPDSVLVLILQHLDVVQLMRMRRVSMHWHHLCTTHPDLLNTLDLNRCNRRVDDQALIKYIAPFAGSRPRHVNMNACFHVTDEGFTALAAACASNARIWKMKSVWDVTGNSILELVSRAPHLEEIDLSNCRKVGDNLLARIVGWITPSQPPGNASTIGLGIATAQSNGATAATTCGCPNLKRISLSYCKHVQDRSMAHIAQHAAKRLEVIDLTRCTSVTDHGFQQWGMHTFPLLRKLILADCTYLTDQAIVAIANAARNLRELDLSFCCALSDTATEVLSLGLTQLTHLDLAFCGSAVSDSSLRCIGLHLLELRHLSVRGCVRVTGQGVEAVVDGCRSLEVFDVSQCKNLASWLALGGIQSLRNRGCRTRFELVADGSWRAPA
ncbi:cyclic nucleotide-binding domain-containing protein [Elsinoe australis]|uniref:Cyclic nucleotide-binding domain-containing protein n=1 Tax=Elsinoe australis TaxID=40998 RepID=A0A4U7AU92_9PEZI|nr:cyclic nucleotide-binding domain-containing protein [Elsinoe australis]